VSASAPAQLLVFGFDAAEARFEGQLCGALERAESGGALRILRAVFVGRDVGSGDLELIDLHGGAGGLVAPLLSFRLDPARRREITAATPDTLKELGADLAPGEAIVAVLVEHSWAAVLADGVARSGGHCLADELVEADDSAGFESRVTEITSRWKRDRVPSAARDC
jgi:hypothetical protein